MNILVIGKIDESLVERYRKNQHEVYFLTNSDRNLPKSMVGKALKIFQTDLNNEETVVDFTHNILQKLDIGFVTTGYDKYLMAKHIISRGLSIPTMSRNSVSIATDKVLMRDAFQKMYPEITPQFKEVSSLDECFNFAEAYGYPIMLKPANLDKSLLVVKCRNKNELISNYKIASAQITKIYQKKSITQHPKLLVEEYLDGMLYSVDVYADDAGSITTLPPVELIFAKDIGINDNHNFARFLPATNIDKLADELKEVAIKAAKAIGLRNSPGHIELVATKRGVKVVEIGARWGGYRVDMHMRANGIDLLEYELASVSGVKAEITPINKGHVAVLEIFAKEEGTLTDIQGTELLNDVKSIYFTGDYESKIGRRYGPAKLGYGPVLLVKMFQLEHSALINDYLLIRDKITPIIN